MNKSLYLVGLNHTTAGVEVRETFGLADCLPGRIIESESGAQSVQGEEQQIIPLGGPIDELAILSTCNRVEIAAVGEQDACRDAVLARWAAARNADVEELKPYVYIHEDLDAVRHLFRVACALDSMVLGEPQILGQLKDAYRMAVKAGTTKVILNRLYHKAFSVAKRVRTETAVGSAAVSISYAAVELAKRIFGEMSKQKAMLIGAGEMAELAAQHLVTSGIKDIYVANRTFERARELAAQFEGQAIPFETLFDRLHEVDIVISSTGSPSAVIRAKDVKAVLKKRRNRPMFFIDIAVPRDIDPDVNTLDSVFLYDIDDLKEVVEENIAQRREEAAKATAIVYDEADAFGQWLKSLELQPTIVELLERNQGIAHKELAKTEKRLAQILGRDVAPEMHEALEILVDSVVKKVLHEPIIFLKRRSAEEESARRYIDTTRRMFNLDDEDIPDDAHADRRRKDIRDDVDARENDLGATSNNGA
ncbi:glutamyl-tRNA reductase [Oceanidesulfovibrio indonesiensis]|uniref:Glutamyl-tRNA reductase n=1 Tax=Oceanidesulfovibrio indonesiensis TaxID=54767 RepID=A0A7M3MC40_9BACT|nr:glutamyl-tRNA reductase [Oceanidesulfovibrio indonesiensis]TVM15873.1 glutamyl-tRNA reductase [Oceanidesulfovibrio indonesiensis]